MALAQHERSMSEEEEEDEEHGFVELDPTSRYGRYSEVLGKGACKTVYRGFDEVEGIEVAWNQVRMQSALESPDGLERLFSEVHLLKALKHKNIMKFYHSWVDTERKNLNFITELFTSGTLRQYRKKHKRVNIKALKNWSRQILRGLLYLHSHDPPIIHRDLKCDNIFINGNQGEVKIGDLGLATILQQAQAPHGVIGTPEFMAPELYEEDYNELIDIYSFGMSLLEMATFEYPYSECKTAAHIYKKVISGKKPAALNMVDDPELRQFIEKCLAKASKRLPARELLTDPFLHLEGDCQALAHSPQSNLAVTCMDDLDDLGLSIDEVNEGSAFMQIRYKQNDWLSANNATPIPPAANGFKSFAGNLLEPVACFHAKADKGRSFGVSVKGKIREDDTVLLRLRITDSEGQVRNIHFPFDIECDTAMSVASEMVAELDFTDQDIPKIAELIDMAIVALIPEWKSGVAIDENFGGDAESILKKHCNVFSSEEIYPRPKPCSTFSSNPSEIIVPDVRIAPRVEGIMHGRFEEFTHHHQMPVLYNYLEEEGTVSCGSLDMINGPVCWDSTEDTECLSSPVSYKSCPGSGSVENWPLSQKCEIVENTESEDSSDELICERNSGLARICENTKYGDPYPVRRHISQNKVEDGNFYWWKSKFQDTTLSSLPSFGILPILDDVDDTDTDTFVDDTAEELRELALKHEEELRELQHKHEAAFLQLRNKCRQKRSFCSLASSTNKQQIDSSCSSLDSEHDSHAEFLNWPYASEARTFSSQRITRLSRIASENDKETRSIRETPLEGIDSSSLEGIDSSSLTSELHM